MSERTFQPNWASPPGETILAILYAKGVSVASFCNDVGLPEGETSALISGLLPITPNLAKALAKSVGSTSHFWLERQKQYQMSLEALALVEPELTLWCDSFPVKRMIESGWLPKPRSKDDTAFELLDYFDVDSIEEWKTRYITRLGITKFRTSSAFQNDVASTTAWIRRGELAFLG